MSHRTVGRRPFGVDAPTAVVTLPLSDRMSNAPSPNFVVECGRRVGANMEAKHHGNFNLAADAEPLEVRVTRYDLRKIRLVQVLLPLCFIFVPLARRFGGAWLVVPAAILCALIVRTLLRAQSSESVLLRTFPDRIKVGATTVRLAEPTSWRWHGRHATLFLAAGNVVVKPRASTRGDVLRSQLHATLGDPLLYTHRGSLAARIAAVVVAALGLLLLGVGVHYRLVYLTLAVGVVIVALAVFATLSGKVCDPSSLPTRDD